MILIAREPAFCILRIWPAPRNNLTVPQGFAIRIGNRISPRTPPISRRLRIPSEVINIHISQARSILELNFRPEGTGTSNLQVIGQAPEYACTAVSANGAVWSCLDIIILPVRKNDILKVVVTLTLKLDAALVKVGIDSVLECVAIIITGKIIVRADFSTAYGLGCQTELISIRATVCCPLAEAEFDFILIRGANVGEKVHTEEVISIHHAAWSTGIRSYIIDKVSKFGAQRAVLAAGHASQAVGKGFLTERRLLMKGWRPLVALVIRCRWVTKLLAEGKVGAHTTAEGVIHSAARFDAVTVVLAVVAIRTDIDDLVCIRILRGLVKGCKLTTIASTKKIYRLN